MSSDRKRRVESLFGLVLLFMAAGCGEAPTSHEDEVEIHELIVSDAGVPIVTAEDGVVTGSISVDAGDETPDLVFTFIDHDGNAVTTGFEADAVVQNTGVGIFHSTADFEGHFEGISMGSTTIVISLVHAADGDSHYDSPAIGLNVN